MGTLKINYVLEGDEKGKKIVAGTSDYISVLGGYSLRKPYVVSYTVIDETNKDQYSIWKGALGVTLLGGFGAVAGIGGKNKKEYLIAIEWENSEKSLVLLDEKYYKMFMKSMF